MGIIRRVSSSCSALRMKPLFFVTALFLAVSHIALADLPTEDPVDVRDSLGWSKCWGSGGTPLTDRYGNYAGCMYPGTGGPGGAPGAGPGGGGGGGGGG